MRHLEGHHLHERHGNQDSAADPGQVKSYFSSDFAAQITTEQNEQRIGHKRP